MDFYIEDDIVTKEEIQSQNYKLIAPQVVAPGDTKPWERLAAELEPAGRWTDERIFLGLHEKNNIARKDKPLDEQKPKSAEGGTPKRRQKDNPEEELKKTSQKDGKPG